MKNEPLENLKEFSLLALEAGLLLILAIFVALVLIVALF